VGSGTGAVGESVNGRNGETANRRSWSLLPWRVFAPSAVGGDVRALREPRASGPHDRTRGATIPGLDKKPMRLHTLRVQPHRLTFQ